MLIRKLTSGLKLEIFSGPNDQILVLRPIHVMLMIGMLKYFSDSEIFQIPDYLSLGSIRPNIENYEAKLTEHIKKVIKYFKAMKADIDYLYNAVQNRWQNKRVQAAFIIQDPENDKVYLAVRTSDNRYWQTSRITFSNFSDEAAPLRSNMADDIEDFYHITDFYKYSVDSFLCSLKKIDDNLRNLIQSLSSKSLAESAGILKDYENKVVKNYNEKLSQKNEDYLEVLAMIKRAVPK